MSKLARLQTTIVQTLPTGWIDTLLICRKCSRKLTGGFGEDGKQTLRQAFRSALREAGRRGDIGIVETRCLGVCPKRAVTTMRASNPGQLVIVPIGTRADKLL